MTEFENKVVFVTGAASGIGQAQALAFLHAGAKVFGVDLQRDFGELSSYKNFHYFSGDLSQPEICRATVACCNQTFGAVDILLNTAGILDDFKDLTATESELWQKVMTTNLDSMFYLTKVL